MIRHGDDVTVLKPGQVTDPYSGETAPSWDTHTETVVPNCVVVPKTSNEPLEAGRSAVVVGYVVHMPYDADVSPQDRVRVLGKVWRVDGEPFHWKNPYTGTQAGLEVSLGRVDG